MGNVLQTAFRKRYTCAYLRTIPSTHVGNDGMATHIRNIDKYNDHAALQSQQNTSKRVAKILTQTV
jgi:hypothetical protein